MLVKGGYLVEVFDKDRNTVIWEVVDEHVVEEGVEHEEVGLQGFDFNLFDEERGVCVGENVKELTYLLMLTKLCLGDLEDQIDQFTGHNFISIKNKVTLSYFPQHIPPSPHQIN